MVRRKTSRRDVPAHTELSRLPSDLACIVQIEAVERAQPLLRQHPRFLNLFTKQTLASPKSAPPCQVSRAARLRRPQAPTIPSPTTGAPGFLSSPSGPPLRPESMEIRAPPTSLRLATPPATASFRPASLRTSFLNGSVSLRAVQVRQSNVNRFKCNAIRSNLFDRLTRLVRSYANAILSSFEDPEKILDQAVLEMNDDLTKMRQATAQVLASQKRLENKYKAAEQADADWYRRAQLALQKGEEDLAREALKRRKSYAENASSLKAQLDQQKSVVENLVSNTRLLESKIAEAKQKKDTLKARAQSAKTATKVSEMLGNVNTSGALSAFEKMEEKVMTMESQAEALGQLGADDLEGKFAMLETTSVDDDLAQMRKEMSGSSLKGELPPGRTTTASKSGSPFRDTEIETELNELRKKTKEY
ncbi:hypothetical protein ZWY2020_027743 [Hordeum vulgare]|nr:hypothetical protein ZWY2020_027743 [Hordeum vulgare]